MIVYSFEKVYSFYESCELCKKIHQNHFANMDKMEAIVVKIRAADSDGHIYNTEVHVFNSYFDALSLIDTHELFKYVESSVYMVNKDSYVYLKKKLLYEPSYSCNVPKGSYNYMNDSKDIIYSNIKDFAGRLFDLRTTPSIIIH